MPKINARIKEHKEHPDSRFLNDVNAFINLHKQNLLTLRSILKDSEEFKDFYNSKVKPELSIAEDSMKDIEAYYENNYFNVLKDVILNEYG